MGRTGVGIWADAPTTLTLRLVATATGTYSLGPRGNGSAMTISGTVNGLNLTWRSLTYPPAGSATIASLSPMQLTGAFRGNADSPEGSGEVLSFEGEFNLEF